MKLILCVNIYLQSFESLMKPSCMHLALLLGLDVVGGGAVVVLVVLLVVVVGGFVGVVPVDCC